MGKTLLSIPNDSLEKVYNSDDTLLVFAAILPIPKPLNPSDFDYADYLKNLQVEGQVRISRNQILRAGKGKKTLFGIAQNIRATAVTRLKKTNIASDERSIIQALVLGEKRDISKKLYEHYAAAGAVHILAVSGLHVSILYLIFAFLLKPLKRLKRGAILHSLIIVILLWCFALLSGLSPSVTRAVTMFSFFAMAEVFGRRTSSINTLFLSFLTLLIINPLWLFQVGFQLSYLAVFFILWMYPLLRKFTHSKYVILRLPKRIIAVSICAQLGVLPLSLYYFHQFPGLFLLTNVVILPVLSIFMFGGILIVLLSFMEGLPHWIAASYSTLVIWLNKFIEWIAVQDAFLFTDIEFSTQKVLASYILIMSTIIFLRKMDFQKLCIALVSVILFLSAFIHGNYRNSSNELVVFHKYKSTVVGNKNGRNFTVLKRDSTEELRRTYPIESYCTETGIKKYSEDILPKVFGKNQKNILVIDSQIVLPKSYPVHYVLLTQSPKVNINRLIDSLKPKQIIADGSNYPSYVQRWRRSCEQQEIPFHYTGEKGAFVIK